MKKECHGLLLNLCTGTQSSGIVPKLTLNIKDKAGGMQMSHEPPQSSQHCNVVRR